MPESMVISAVEARLHRAQKIHLQARIWLVFSRTMNIVLVDFMPQGHNVSANLVTVGLCLRYCLIDYDQQFAKSDEVSCEGSKSSSSSFEFEFELTRL